MNCLIDVSLLFEYKRDAVCAQYANFCLEFQHELQCHERKQERLDKFFMRLIKHDNAYVTLREALKLLLLLGHGQAPVKRGLSLKKQIAVKDMADIAYVSQQLICEAIKIHGGVLRFLFRRS